MPKTFAILLLLPALLLVGCTVATEQKPEAATAEQKQTEAGEQEQDEEKYWDDDLSSIQEHCWQTGSNVFMTECLIELLDRKAAEREWKQRKLEFAKHPEINEYNLFGVLKDEQKKISIWRGGFEEMRDSWCEARYAFVDGSGIPGDIASCKLEFELLAIKDLNNIYYTVLKDMYDSDGIPGFEPDYTKINALIQVNKTSRGCVWAGEENCDDEAETSMAGVEQEEENANAGQEVQVLNSIDEVSVESAPSEQLDISQLTYNEVLNFKDITIEHFGYYDSIYNGKIIQWEGQIGPYTQISGMKLCVIDDEHQNVNAKKPCDWFWAVPNDTPYWNGSWVEYILKRYVGLTSDQIIPDSTYSVIGTVAGIDCGIDYNKCIPDITIIDILPVESR